MEDEIDIEEHDVLEHPRIRDMLLGLQVKTEVEDYEETGMDVEESYQPYISTAYEDAVNSDLMDLEGTSGTLTHGTLTHLEYEEGIEDLDSQGPLVVSPQKIRNNTECYQHTDNQDGGETSILKALLSDPVSGDESDNQEDPEEEYPLPECSVLLEDCKSFLQSNPCFCKECEILFPTDNDFDAHKMISHSFLVAVTKNKAVKSTSKSFDSPTNCNLLCSHCDVVFPNTIALLHHTYNLLPGKFACDKCDLLFENDAACQQHRVSHFGETGRTAGQEYLICKVCTCHFKYYTRYRAHMKWSHSIEDPGVMQEVSSNFQCPLCPSSSENIFLNNTTYNKHIAKKHLSFYRKQGNDSGEKPQCKCPKCNMFFSSNYSVRIHLAAKHGYVGTVENSKQLASSKSNSSKTVVPKKLNNFLQIPSSPKTGLKKLNNFSQVPSSLKAVPKKLNNISQVPSSPKTWPLSKSTLFKCNKCQIHFVSCISATIHSTQCRTKKDFFQCTQCNRSIKLQDRLYHRYQHNVSNKFKVIVASRNILNRILCKCTTCNVCFDERSFITHHTNICDGETPSIYCMDCKIWIHTKAMAAHKKLHANVASKEFIIVDYVHAETSVKELTANVTEDDENDVKTVMDSKNSKVKTKFANKIGRKDKYAYFYCPTCKCNMKVKRGLHHIGKCDPKQQSATCKLCGLRFTIKGLKSHQVLHGEFPKLKLKDLKFVNIQTDKIINAPFPNFKKCKRCDVTFYSYNALRCHTCNDEEAKSCKYCREKFSDAAYKLHVPYHEYAMASKKPNSIASKVSKVNEKDELIKKYESLKQVWNILFLCQTCGIVMDDYDRAVEHCQDHFCNMQSYNVTIEHCDTCDLNFVDDCYEKHKELHVNNHINKDSFKLIEYTYENLLLDSWMDIFRSLTKEQINLILSKSIYRFTRCVRMKVVTNGRTNLTLYQCGICQLIVASDKVNEHAQNINDICEGSRKFPCSQCTLTFAYKRHREIHEELHKVWKLNAGSFRIVQFYAEKQFSATVVKNDKKDSMDSHSLKFIRCQRCGKLINKHKYKMHTKNHVYYAKYRAKTNLSKPVQRKKVGLKFLVCKSCNLCVSRRYHKNHVCNPNAPTSKCTQCSLLFRDKAMSSHYGYHMRYAFNSSKINVVYFQNGTMLNDSDNVKAEHFQSNEEMSVGNKNIKKKLPHSILRHKMQPGKRTTLRSIIQKKVLVVYQCVRCNICLWLRHNVPRHICVAPSRQVQCDICGLIEHTTKKIAHSRLHELRQFDAGSLKYVKFTPEASRSSNSPVNTHLARKRKPLATFEGTVVKRRRLNTNINENDDEGSNPDNIASKINQDSNMDEDGKGNETTLVSKPKVGVARESEIPFEKSRLFTDYISNRYYKCKNCKLLFVTCTGLVNHEEVCGENGDTVKNNEAVKCKDCGLAFHASMIKQHKLLQKCKLHLEERVSLVTIKQKGKSHNDHRNWLYLCPPCEFYTFSLYSIRHHFQNQHQTKKNFKTCTDCGLTFSSVSFKRHYQLYHRGDIGISDLYIASVEDTNLEDALKDSPKDEDIIYVGGELYESHLTTDIKSPVNEKSTFDEESNSIVYDSVNNDSITDGSPITYTCKVCHLSFITAGGLASHYRRGKHNLKKIKCDLCGLNFTDKSLDGHMRLHHSDQDTNNENKTEINDTTVDSVSSSFDNENQNDTSIEEYPFNNENENENNRDTIATTKLNDELETESVSEENIGNENCKDVIVISNPNDKFESANVFKTTESNIETVNNTRDNNCGTSDFIPVNSNEFKTNMVPNTINIELNKNKLYKCSQCDVYYLTADDCREHTDRHTQLDPTEYIACKICDLQFCCEYLGRHMKSHREKTFCIDDLIVAEYHIEHGHVRIDTYLAVDRLKTKLVSTTSDFDTVDSTTVESS